MATNENNENLKDLVGQFFNAEEAGRVVEDVREGERIVREYGAPEPDKRLIADIKGEVGRALGERKSKAFRRAVYKVAAVAAAIVIVAAISVKLSERGNGEAETVAAASMIPAAVWESDDIAVDDIELGTIVGEIEELEGDLLALELGENGGNAYEIIEELEAELEEIEGVFWKG
jgi:hypothetical protein